MMWPFDRRTICEKKGHSWNVIAGYEDGTTGPCDGSGCLREGCDVIYKAPPPPVPAAAGKPSASATPCPETTLVSTCEGPPQEVPCELEAGHEGQCCGHLLYRGEPSGYQWWGANDLPYDDYVGR